VIFLTENKVTQLLIQKCFLYKCEF